VPYLNFAPLQNSLAKLKESCRKFEAARTAAETNHWKFEADRTAAETNHLLQSTAQALDDVLIKMEQTLTTPEGLPRRPWYKHAIYAPGFYTGYSAKTLPGIREAIEQRNWPEATQQIEIVARTLETFAGKLDRARRLIPGSDASPQ
jgi:N-acetylated-alpha-linked acidic dipeptidase